MPPFPYVNRPPVESDRPCYWIPGKGLLTQPSWNGTRQVGQLESFVVIEESGTPRDLLEQLRFGKS